MKLLTAFIQDVKCFAGTIASVLKHDGVVEGGTGSLSDPNGDWQTERNKGAASPIADEAGFEDYGFRKKFHIDKTAHKKILITGADSYIGESFAKYCKEHYPNIDVTMIDMVDGSWRDYDFRGFDSVFHVAGLAHADVGKITLEQQKKYYEVNTDLVIETARKARASGVGQFLFMSSMIIYGDSAPYGKKRVIDENTMPSPTNFYGDSKWQADKGIRALQTPDFHVAVLRSPMIYGRDSKGNYSALSKMVRRLPVFPDANNSRSMLYIGNLCEFVSLLILSGESGVYFPQNRTYTKTSSMAEAIADETWHKLHITKLLNPAVEIASHVPGKASRLMNKAFGNCVYAHSLSTYSGLGYQLYDFKTSIELTEGCGDEG